MSCQPARVAEQLENGRESPPDGVGGNAKENRPKETRNGGKKEVFGGSPTIWVYRTMNAISCTPVPTLTWEEDRKRFRTGRMGKAAKENRTGRKHVSVHAFVRTRTEGHGGAVSQTCVRQKSRRLSERRNGASRKRGGETAHGGQVCIGHMALDKRRGV